jgi:hypothetical protein
VVASVGMEDFDPVPPEVVDQAKAAFNEGEPAGPPPSFPPRPPNRAARRQAQREEARMARVFAQRRAAAERGEGPPKPIQGRNLGQILDTFSPLGDLDQALAGQIEQAEADLRQARMLDERTGQLLASIPPHLHNTDECRLLVGRMQASWLNPVSPAQRERWMAEWLTFVQAQPEAIAARARQSGLWVP